MSNGVVLAALAITFTIVAPAVAGSPSNGSGAPSARTAGTAGNAGSAGNAGNAVNAGNAGNAGNAAWIDKSVRVHFGAEQDAAITGKVTRFDGCLYVKLDQARDGITLIRMDQVTRLQVRNGAAWAAHDLRAVLAREPAHCSAEANG